MSEAAADSVFSGGGVGAGAGAADPPGVHSAAAADGFHSEALTFIVGMPSFGCCFVVVVCLCLCLLPSLVVAPGCCALLCLRIGGKNCEAPKQKIL